ncbi:uncharacterized protein VTP21DRAFT_5292 [Calcarisporiella thermophila]|uniref:uncharacterized protein n=1 Tax=Calcarisporiella thermophila TaxID=911321 RepID=UPI003744158C
MRFCSKSFAFLSLILTGCADAFASKEVFNEELLIKPLRDGKQLTHAQFTTRWDASVHLEETATHYGLFPRAIGQVLQNFGVHELHLTFTQGRWDYEEWGYPIFPSAGRGVELWAVMDVVDADRNWKSLTNTLSGLFCASLNFIDDTLTVEPKLSFRHDDEFERWRNHNGTVLRYGALARESVCTENLTPWIKLLPCKSKSGIAALLNAYKHYNSNFHSMAIHARHSCSDKECSHKVLELVQTVTSVFDPVPRTAKRDWSIRSLFDRTIQGACPVASSSRLLVMLPEDPSTYSLSQPPSEVFDSSSQENSVNRKIAVYDLKQIQGDFDLSMNWNEEKFEYSTKKEPLARLVAHRSITGYGQERGGITVRIENQSAESLSVTYFDAVPWFLRLYLHTLNVKVLNSSSALHNNSTTHQKDLVEKIFYQQAKDRERPALIEMIATVPPRSVVAVSIDFDMAFLKYTEHRPDANRGFDIGPAVVMASLSDSQDFIFPQNYGFSPLTLGQRSTSVVQTCRVYTENLLVSLPTPDFSMPYNVITLTCTVIAMAFGFIFNLITRRFVLVEEEEKQKKKEKEEVEKKVT